MKNVLTVRVAAIVLARISTSAAADPSPLQRELSMDLAIGGPLGLKNLYRLFS